MAHLDYQQYIEKAEGNVADPSNGVHTIDKLSDNDSSQFQAERIPLGDLYVNN